MPHTDIHAIRVVDELKKSHNIVKVIERLADAHQNDI